MFPFNKPKADAAPSDDIVAIRGKLAVVELEIATASSDLDKLALQAVLTDDQLAGEATSRMVALTHRRDLLSRALVAASAAEQERLAAARHREFQARRRSAAQHAARLEKLARSISEAEQVLIGEFGKFAEVAGALVATLPGCMRSIAEPWHEILGPDALAGMALLEGYRLDRERGPTLFARPPTASEHERRIDGSLPTLTERIASMTALVRSNFDLASPGNPQTPLDLRKHTADTTEPAEMEVTNA